MKVKQKPAEKVWADFQSSEQLTDRQLEQFQKYQAFLHARNKEFNLTAITDLSGVVRQHFVDSLALRKFVDLNSLKCIADIGSGAGFPGIPLKIMFPHLKVILLEVTKKKQQFLDEVITLLGLENIFICDIDWRNFVRTTEDEIDLFVTRAAIADEEICRAFRPACWYRNSTIVYWASELWEPAKKSTPFVHHIERYALGNKKRLLVFFKTGSNDQAAPQQD